MSFAPLSSPSSPSFARRRPLSERVELGLTIVLAVIGVVVAVLSLMYLFYANEKATQDYHLRALQEKRSELVQANEILAAQIASQESLIALSANEQITKMANAKNPLYLRNTAVARNE